MSTLDAALTRALEAPAGTLEALLSGQVGPVEAGTASEGVTGATASGTGLACAIAECVGGCTGEARVEVGASGAPPQAFVSGVGDGELAQDGGGGGPALIPLEQVIKGAEQALIGDVVTGKAGILAGEGLVQAGVIDI